MRGAKRQGRATSASRDAVVWSVHWLLLTCSVSVSEEFRIIEKWPMLVRITIREMNRRFISSGDTLAVTRYGRWRSLDAIGWSWCLRGSPAVVQTWPVTGLSLSQLTAGFWVEGIRRRSQSMAFMAKVGKLKGGGGYKNMDNKGRVLNLFN